MSTFEKSISRYKTLYCHDCRKGQVAEKVDLLNDDGYWECTYCGYVIKCDTCGMVWDWRHACPAFPADI